MKLLAFIFSLIWVQFTLANELSINYSSFPELKNALNEVASLMPEKLKSGLPQNIELRVEKLSNDETIPNDICNPKDVKPFIYGRYNKLQNRLTLNSAVYSELKRGRTTSKTIYCQHKSLYDQAIATIIHELTHAFDLNNQNPSRQIDFINRAGFKKGLLKIKNKNLSAMRSVDTYELTNIAEAYAVNMEYFAMDPEFACRKPAMFDFYKKSFQVDPYPNRSCIMNDTVMVSTHTGFEASKIDINRVYRIDYLMASAGQDLSSGFGHSMFRIVMCAPERLDTFTQKLIPATPFGPKCLEDKLFHFVVSYRANVEDATLNYVKGIFGGYPSMLYILNLSDVLDEYNRDELRDVVAYPLNLSQLEINDFIKKVIEEHWNYRGSYKFFTNNCAVESYGLLKSSLSRSQLQSASSVTPNGVLEDLDKLSFISLKSNKQIVFEAHSSQLLNAYQIAYGKSVDKKEIINFVSKSNVESRLQKFNNFNLEKNETLDLHDELISLKNKLTRSASFAVIEQQILRFKSMELRKKIADLLINSKDPILNKIVAENSVYLKQDFQNLSNSGYGIPLIEEMISSSDLNNKSQKAKNAVATLEEIVRNLLQNEITTIEAINSNVNIFNQNSINIRKEFKQKLNLYIHKSIIEKNLQSAGLKNIREVLDPILLSEKEISDTSLEKLITEE